jgi:hypothetical protein
VIGLPSITRRTTTSVRMSEPSHQWPSPASQYQTEPPHIEYPQSSKEHCHTSNGIMTAGRCTLVAAAGSTDYTTHCKVEDTNECKHKSAHTQEAVQGFGVLVAL